MHRLKKKLKISNFLLALVVECTLRVLIFDWSPQMKRRAHTKLLVTESQLQNAAESFKFLISFVMADRNQS